MLDPDEVTSTAYVCKDLSGAVLVELSDEAPGDNCELGGLRVDEGIDADGNGTLDSAEIDTTDDLCNGADGATSPEGASGEQGEQGEQGEAGPTGPAGRSRSWRNALLRDLECGVM